MISARVIDSGRNGCDECGHYPEDLKLKEVQVVYPHAKARLCTDCLRRLIGELEEVLPDAYKP